MATDYPGAIDTASKLPNPNAGDHTNSPSHSSLHDNANDAIKAVETKLGTGASVPASNTLLFGTGAGASAFTQLTSAQLAASLTDETGTGLVVFGTTPTLVTPKIDTINESTPSNGVTVAGLNIKSGVLQTANSVTASNIASASVTPSKLATGAVTALIATSESTASTSYVDLATVGPTVTVTIGANGLALVILYAAFSSATATVNSHMGFAISGASTQVAADNFSDQVRQTDASAAGLERQGADFLITGLTPGSTTFTAKYRANAATAIFADRRIAVIPL